MTAKIELDLTGITLTDKETLLINVTFDAVNALFAKLDESWDKFSEDDPVELTDLFAQIGNNLVQYLQAYAKELGDTDDELVHAFFCGIVNILLNSSNKKYLKDIITDISKNKKA